MVTGAFILFGLPLTAVLARGEDEDATTYAAAGAGLGMLLPLTFAVYHGGFVAGLVLALPGGLAGLVTGLIWGRWREARRTSQETFS